MNHTNLPQIEIKTFDFIGTALICQWNLGQFDTIASTMTENEIKQRFAQKIATTMLELHLVEFTKSEDTISGTVSFKARAFVLPDSQVKTLRIEKLI